MSTAPALAQTVPDSLFREWQATKVGGVVCVLKNGKVVYQKAFDPGSPQHSYELASNAKQFTAMAIALLEEQGMMSANDPLRKYYPQLRIKDDIMVRNLLDHTSGLRDAAVLAVLSGKMNLKGEVRKKFETKEYYIKCFLSETDLNFPVGSEMSYTNFNYVLLGDIVEKVSGKTLHQFLDSAVFNPLGMDHTFLRDGIVGDHNMASTVEDLIKWQFNFADNKLGKKDPALIAKVTTASKLDNGSPTFYGYGLFCTTYKGVNVVYHGGDDGRSTSMLLRFPDQDLSVIVLSSSPRYDITEKTAFGVSEIFLQDLLDEPVRGTSSYDDYTFINLEPGQLQSKAGLYTRVTERGLAQMIRLTFKNGKLYESWGSQSAEFELSAVTPSHLIARVKNNNRVISLKFDDDGQGFIYRFHNQDSLHFSRWQPVKNSLTDYSGSYKNESTGATIKVKKKGEKLVARKGILRIPLTDFAADKFYAPGNDALFSFVRDDKGTVSSLRVDAWDFRNFWFTRKNK